MAYVLVSCDYFHKRQNLSSDWIQQKNAKNIKCSDNLLSNLDKNIDIKKIEYLSLAHKKNFEDGYYAALAYNKITNKKLVLVFSAHNPVKPDYYNNIYYNNDFEILSLKIAKEYIQIYLYSNHADYLALKKIAINLTNQNSNYSIQANTSFKHLIKLPSFQYLDAAKIQFSSEHSFMFSGYIDDFVYITMDANLNYRPFKKNKYQSYTQEPSQDVSSYIFKQELNYRVVELSKNLKGQNQSNKLFDNYFLASIKSQKDKNSQKITNNLEIIKIFDYKNYKQNIDKTSTKHTFLLAYPVKDYKIKAVSDNIVILATHSPGIDELTSDIHVYKINLEDYDHSNNAKNIINPQNTLLPVVTKNFKSSYVDNLNIFAVGQKIYLVYFYWQNQKKLLALSELFKKTINVKNHRYEKTNNNSSFTSMDFKSFDTSSSIKQIIASKKDDNNYKSGLAHLNFIIKEGSRDQKKTYKLCSIFIN